tara:strand:+ start:55 stop:942 length:888 start_codon:yes stop_codon:yes gene_type:complete
MNHIEDEWIDYVRGTAFLSPHTIKSYKNSHTKLTNELGIPIRDATVGEVLDTVRGLTDNPSSQATLYTAVIVFRKLAGLDNDPIWKEKKALVPHQQALRQIASASKKEYLPTMETLKKHLNEQFYNENWRGYIINFLLINYNTRNADLDVEFVDTIHKTKADKKRNYIVSRKNDFVYIRNNYKTFAKYKQKRHIFKSIPFARAVKYYKAQHAPNQPIFLLDKEGLPINNNSIANYIKKFTYKNLTEGDYNKVAVSAITEIADLRLLEALGERRGTDLRTLIEYYNIPYSEKLWTH